MDICFEAHFFPIAILFLFLNGFYFMNGYNNTMHLNGFFKHLVIKLNIDSISKKIHKSLLTILNSNYNGFKHAIVLGKFWHKSLVLWSPLFLKKQPRKNAILFFKCPLVLYKILQIARQNFKHRFLQH